MKGLRAFLRETWWVFAAASVAAVALGRLSGMWFYYAFPPRLIPVAVYTASVRYNSDGNVRDQARRR